MGFQIMSLDINNEMDVMLAHRRGMQFAKFSGISLAEQTRFATAVSEISRNCIEYATKGNVNFSIEKKLDKLILLAVITDEGKGIANLKEIMNRDTQHYRGRGLGIVYARKLVENLRIVTGPKGTTVTIQKNIPVNAPPISTIIVKGWVKHLQDEPAISAYEELKMRNAQLVELTEELRANINTVDKQIEEINKLNHRLSVNNARMNAFTYAISHDLKTPLTNLRISSKYLIEDSEREDSAVFKDILSRAVSRLDKTIFSLIEMLDIQSQEKQVMRQLDFATFFVEMLDEFEQEIKLASATITSNFNNAASIKYIEGFLQSILRNLLSNALKYRDASRPLEISIRTVPIQDGVLLIFEDTGSGMDLKLIGDRLFAPFARFSNTAEGKGIGLYLIKSLVENNGGSVSVESTPGKGTIFYFNLLQY